MPAAGLGAGGQVSLPFRGLAWGHCGLSAGPSGGAGSRDPNPEEQWLRTRGACAGLPGQRREPTGLQASRPGAPSPAQPPEGPRHGLCLRDSGLRQRGLCSLETCPEGPAIPTSSPASRGSPRPPSGPAPPRRPRPPAPTCASPLALSFQQTQAKPPSTRGESQKYDSEGGLPAPS